MHVFQSQNDFRRVKLHVRLIKHAVLRKVVVQVTTVHQVENEAELAGRVKSISHANDKRAIFAGWYEAQHCSFVQRQCFALLHLDSLFIETFHCIHLAGVDLPTPVHLTEATASYYAKDAEVIHRELLKGESVKRGQIRLVCCYLQIKLKILPLKKPCVAWTLHEALERVASQMVENLFDVGLEEICGNLILLQETVDMSDTLFGVFLDKGERISLSRFECI